MKLSETIYLSLSVVAFIIGVHQSFFWGISESYWLFMISGSLFLLFRYQKISEAGKQQSATPANAAQRGKIQAKAAPHKNRKK
jgi:Mg2+/citrate symporter